ncbi:MAG TPA: hypothetical protein VMA77_01905 [Solirubrobacteraceae bacterium]|nr:hypothetical protein [Solirubrobacteraceae bacterium]
MDRTRHLWLVALNAHVRAVHAHEIAAALFDRLGDGSRADIELQRAASERLAYAHAAAQHPEWAVDVSVGLVRVRGPRLGAASRRSRSPDDL